MIPDVVVTWPASCDYPLWRRWLAQERSRFDRVIVAFSSAPGLPDYRSHVRSVTSGVTFIDTRWDDGRDWRDAAVNAALNASDAEWVWFTEQDFLVRDPRFWSVSDAFGGCLRASAIGTMQGEARWHPCCLFVRRSTINRTSCDFSVTDDGDHFARFGRELAEIGARVVDLDYWVEPTWYRHMQGLSHNHSLVERGEPVTFKPDEFADYLRACLTDTSDLCVEWGRTHTAWLRWYDTIKEGR